MCTSERIEGISAPANMREVSSRMRDDEKIGEACRCCWSGRKLVFLQKALFRILLVSFWSCSYARLIRRGTVPSPERLDVDLLCPFRALSQGRQGRESTRATQVEAKLPSWSLDWMLTGILLSCIVLQIESTTRTDPSQATCMMRARSVVVGAQT